MTIIGILLAILTLGVIIWAAFWLIDLINGNLPARAGQILKVIVPIIALIYIIGILTRGMSIPRLH